MTQDRPSLARLLILPAAAFLALPSIATAGPVTTMNYNCDLNGAPARLTARVETIRGGGVVSDRTGGIGVLPIGGASYLYEGQLVSQTARYYFTGRDSFADFVGAGNERFRVQFVHHGNRMTMIVNPHGPGPAQHMCQRTR
ncbi:MAG TPA: hypothetical protein VES64_04350 [Allosphingosinicella sp.]|nr:hypothetical protein [Allosphingosinicella sp.]